MIRLALAAVGAVVVVVAAVDAAGTVWALPLAYAAVAAGALLVLFEGRDVQ